MEGGWRAFFTLAPIQLVVYISHILCKVFWDVGSENVDNRLAELASTPGSPPGQFQHGGGVDPAHPKIHDSLYNRVKIIPLCY